MGWNTWYYNFQYVYPPSGAGAWQPTEAYVKAQADALVSSGLAALGYTIVGIDAAWMDRDASGNLRGIPAQFPDGMAAVATYMHNAGLQLGLYGTPSTPCVPGTINQGGYEMQDARTIASWGADFWKYDACGISGTNAFVQAAFQEFGTALQVSGRDISYLVNAYANFNSVAWYATVGSTTVRIGSDNGDTYWYLKATSLDWTTYSPYQNKGHWLDPDYLMGGLKEGANGVVGAGTLCGTTEARAQFNWYAIIAAPLVIGTRIDLLDATNLTTYSNSEVIAVNQDALGIMGAKVQTDTHGSYVCQVWVRQLQTGYAICMINYDPSLAHDVTITWATAGVAAGTWDIRDLWAHASAGSSATGITVTLPAWGSAMYKITQ